MTLRCALVGCGQMGTAIGAVLETRGQEIVARVDYDDSVSTLSPDTVDVAFEFTAPQAAATVLRDLAEAGVATVSGTTSWDGVAAVEELFTAKQVPFLHAPNFALGVQLFFRLATAMGAAARRLEGYDAGVVERHHTLKKDSPSGTAQEAARRFEAASGRSVDVVALRQGGQPGEHRLIVEGPLETLELTHRSRSRALFAEGAVTAAEWLVASGRRGHVPFDHFLADLFEEDER